MKDETKIIQGLVVNIFEKNNNDAIILVINDKIKIFLLVKGFYKLQNKNKSNISIGSISEFEYFINYGNNFNFLLKKATMISFWNYLEEENKFIEKNMFLLKQITKPNKEIYNGYQKMLCEENKLIKNFILTYILINLLKEKGLGLSCEKCSICKSNQNLYAFDLNEGGILCFEHSTKKSITFLKCVKSFYSIGISCDEYIKNTDQNTNEFLFNLIFRFINF